MMSPVDVDLPATVAATGYIGMSCRFTNSVAAFFPVMKSMYWAASAAFFAFVGIAHGRPPEPVVTYGRPAFSGGGRKKPTFLCIVCCSWVLNQLPVMMNSASPLA